MLFNSFFQHDNETKPTLRLVLSSLSSQNIDVLDWSLQFHDLNLIENLWAIIKRTKLLSTKILANATKLSKRIRINMPTFDKKFAERTCKCCSKQGLPDKL